MINRLHVCLRYCVHSSYDLILPMHRKQDILKDLKRQFHSQESYYIFVISLCFDS